MPGVAIPDAKSIAGVAPPVLVVRPVDQHPGDEPVHHSNGDAEYHRIVWPDLDPSDQSDHRSSAGYDHQSDFGLDQCCRFRAVHHPSGGVEHGPGAGLEHHRFGQSDFGSGTVFDHVASGGVEHHANSGSDQHVLKSVDRLRSNHLDLQSGTGVDHDAG